MADTLRSNYDLNVLPALAAIGRVQAKAERSFTAKLNVTVDQSKVTAVVRSLSQPVTTRVNVDPSGLELAAVKKAALSPPTEFDLIALDASVDDAAANKAQLAAPTEFDLIALDHSVDDAAAAKTQLAAPTQFDLIALDSSIDDAATAKAQLSAPVTFPLLADTGAFDSSVADLRGAIDGGGGGGAAAGGLLGSLLAINPATAVVAGGIGGVAASLFGMVDASKEAEASLREVATLQLPGFGIEEARAAMDEFAAITGQAANENIPALYEALSSDISTDNVVDFLVTSSELASAGVAELTPTVKVLAGALSSYADQNLSAADASNALFAAVGVGVTTIPELAVQLGQVAPVAAAANVSFVELNAAIADITKTGVSTNIAVTQVRSAIAELLTSTSKAGKAFEEVAGTSFPKFLAAGGSLTGALDLLQQAADDSGVGINELFGSIEAGSAVLALTRQEGQAFQATLDAVSETVAEGTAVSEAYRINQAGLGATLDRLGGQVEALQVKIGDLLNPVVARFAGFVEAQVVPAVNGLVDGFIVAADELDGVADAVTGVTGPLAGLTGAFGGLSNSFLDANAVEVTRAGVADVAAAATDAVAPIEGLSNAFLDANAVFSGSGEYKTGLSGFVAYQLVPFIRDEAIPVLKEFRDFVVDDVVPGLVAVAETVLPPVLEAAGVVVGFVTDTALPVVTEVAREVGPTVLAALGGVLEFVSGTALPTVAGVAAAVLPVVGDVVIGVAGFIRDQAIPAVVQFGEFIAPVVDIIGQVAPIAFEHFVDKGGRLLELIGGITATVRDEFGPIVTETFQGVTAALSGGEEQEGFAAAADNAAAVSGGAFDLITTVIQGAADVVLPVLRDIADITGTLIVAGVTAMTDTIIPAFNDIMTLARDEFGPVFATALGDAQGASEDLGGAIGDGSGGLVADVKTAITVFTEDFLPVVADLVVAFNEEVIPAAASVAEFIVDDVVPAVQSAADKFEEWWPAIRTTGQNIGDLVSIGSRVARTVLDPMVSTVELLVDAYDALTSPLETAVRLFERLDDVGPLPSVPSASGILGVLPGFERGGIIRRPTALIAGERFRPEVIAPITDMRRTVDLFTEARAIDGLLAELSRRYPHALVGDVAGSGHGGRVVSLTSPTVINVAVPDGMNTVAVGREVARQARAGSEAAAARALRAASNRKAA